MPDISIVSQNIPNWQGEETVLYRRVYASHSFYDDNDNLIPAGSVDSDDFFKGPDECPVVGGTIQMPELILPSTVDKEQVQRCIPTYTVCLYDADGNNRYTVLANFRMPDAFMFDTASWQDVDIYNRQSLPPTPVGYLTAQQIYELLQQFNGLVACPDATHLVKGKSKLSANPFGNPVAVGTLDKQWTALSRTVYLEQYSNDLAAAVAAIGSTRAKLVISQNFTLNAASVITHQNTIVQFEGQGKATLTNGAHLTISTFGEHPKYQYFFCDATSNVHFAKQAADIYHIEWWTGPGFGLDYTHEFQQAMVTLENQGAQGGGILDIGVGEFLADEITIPNFSTIQGKGFDPDAGAYGDSSGTVIRIASEDAGYVFTLVDAFRMVQIKNLSISTFGAPGAHCVLVNRSNLNASGFFFHCTEVTFQSDQTPTAHSVRFYDTNGNGIAEMIGIVFNNCWWQHHDSLSADEPTAAFFIDTVNSNVHWAGINTFQIGANSDAIQARRRGWWLIDELDARGVFPEELVYTTVKDRDITSATLTEYTGYDPYGLDESDDPYFGLLTLDPATPQDKQFNPNDEGQRVKIGPHQDYLFEILSSFTAVYSRYHGSDIVAQPAEVHRWDVFEGKSHAVFNLRGDNRSLVVNGGADEGFNYSFIGSGNLFFPNIFNGYTGQGRVQFIESNMMFQSNGSRWYAGAFHDDTEGPETMASFDQYTEFDFHTVYGDVYVRTGFAWGHRPFGEPGAPATRTMSDMSLKQKWENPPLGSDSSFSNPFIFGNDTGYIFSGWNGQDKPILWTAQRVRRQSESDDQIIQHRMGLQDYFGHWFLWYDDVYNDFNGEREFRGNQDGVKGYNFDSYIKATSFVGAVLEYDLPFNLDWHSIDERYSTIRYNTTGTRAIGGISVDGLYQPIFDGQGFWVGNVGSGTLTLLHEYTATGPPPATARFHNDSGEDIYLLPGERAWVQYDATLERLAVSQFRNPDAQLGKAFYLYTPFTRNNSTTKVATPFVFSIPRPGAYSIELLLHQSAVASKFSCNFATTATITDYISQWNWENQDDHSTYENVRLTGGDYTIGMHPAFTGDICYKLLATFIATSAGTITLQAGQQAAVSETTTFEKGSWGRITRLKTVP